MSTVGYGDVYCETILGRTFLVFFLLVGLVSCCLSISSHLISIFDDLLQQINGTFFVESRDQAYQSIQGIVQGRTRY